MQKAVIQVISQDDWSHQITAGNTPTIESPHIKIAVVGFG